MSITSNVQIRRSYANSAPTFLLDGQLGYSFVSDKLFIGDSSNTGIVIAGNTYIAQIESATSEDVPDTLVKRASNGYVRFGRTIVDAYPDTVIDVANKGYVDNVVANSYGTIYYGLVGETGYSNVITSSSGIDVTANNIQVARFRQDQIYLDTDVSVLGNIYLHDVISSGNLESQYIIAYQKFLAGIATSSHTVLPNTIAQFTGNTSTYVQVNAQNINPNGSADYVVTADNGTDTTFFIDMGIQGSSAYYDTLKPYDGYLLVQGNTGQSGGNLIIGTISGTPGLETRILSGGTADENTVVVFNSDGANVHGTLFANTLISPTINVINSSVSELFAALGSSNTVSQSYTDTANTYNQNYTNTANTFLQANDTVTLQSAKNWANSYTDAANTWLQANDGITLTSSKNYTDTANTNLRLYVDGKVSANLTTATSYTDTANTNLRLYVDGKVSANLTTATTYTDTANTNLRLYVNDNITANLNIAKAYTDTANTTLHDYIDSESTLNQLWTNAANTWLQANDAFTLSVANSYTDISNTNLRLYVDGKVSANLVLAKDYTDSTNNYLSGVDSTNFTTLQNYTNTANTFLQANDAITLGVATNYTDNANTWLRANDGITLTAAKNYTDSSNTWLQANDLVTLTAANYYTDSSNTWLQGNVYNTLVAAKAYTDTANSYNQDLTSQVSVGANNYTDNANTWLRANDGITLTSAKNYTDTANTNLRLYTNDNITLNLNASKSYTDTANTYLQANTGLGLLGANNYTDKANTFLQANDAFTLAVANSYTLSTNTWLQGNDAVTLASAKSYTDTANSFAQGLVSYSDAVNVYQNTYIGVAHAHANSAYATANLKLNTSGGDIAFINVASNVSIGTSVDFDVTKPESSWKEGRLWYDKYSKALAYFNDTSGYIHVGMDTVIRVWNNTGSTIPAAKALYISGPSSANGVLSVALANAISQSSSEVIGLSQRAIPAGAYGLAVKNGVIEYQDTSTLTSGQQFYLSDTVPGGLTTTPPAPPSVPLQLAYVTNISPTYGEYIVDIHLMEGINKTSGAILFARDNAIDQDPNDLYWDYANNSLGIGTNEPAANLHVVGSGLFTGNVTISGNLLVSNAQAITTTELTVGGNTIILNSEATGSPVSNAEIIVNRGSSTNVYIQWNEVADHWYVYSGVGNPGHILDSEETFTTWTQYTAGDTYEKLTHPIGADLANATNEHATAGFAVANIAYTNALSGYIHANAAYVSQNTTGVYANSAYLSQNTTGVYANTAYLHANAAYVSQNTTGVYANTVYLHANSAYVSQNTTGVYANSAFQAANSSGVYANSAYQASNSASSYANSAYTQANTTSQYASSGSFTTSSTSQVAVDSWSSSTYRSATYQLQLTSGSNYHVLDVKLMHDGSTVWWNGYGELWNTAKLATFSGTINGGNVELLITPVNSSTVVKFVRSLINT